MYSEDISKEAQPLYPNRVDFEILVIGDARKKKKKILCSDKHLAYKNDCLTGNILAISKVLIVGDRTSPLY